MKSDVIKSAILIEAAGFLLAIVSIWVNEFFDLPHYLFGFEPIQVNLSDMIFETFFVMCFGAIAIFLTWRLERRVTQLEKILPICSFCKKIRAPESDPERQESWFVLEQYIGEKTGSQFSHGVCPECGRKHYGEYLK